MAREYNFAAICCRPSARPSCKAFRYALFFCNVRSETPTVSAIIDTLKPIAAQRRMTPASTWVLVCVLLGVEPRAIPHDSKPQSIERTRVRAKYVKTATKPAQTPKLALPLRIDATCYHNVG
jgi:hypothetical protein